VLSYPTPTSSPVSAVRSRLPRDGWAKPKLPEHPSARSHPVAETCAQHMAIAEQIDRVIGTHAQTVCFFAEGLVGLGRSPHDITGLHEHIKET
jgi:hypothetical protein